MKFKISDLISNKEFLITIGNCDADLFMRLYRKGDLMRIGRNYVVITDVQDSTILRVKRIDPPLHHFLFVITGIWLILLPIITKCLY